MAPFKNDCGQKTSIQAVQDTKWHLSKMTVAKKTELDSVKYKMAPFKNDWPKKSESNSARFQKTPFENDCGQKNRTKQCKIQNGTFLKMTERRPC